MVGAVPLLPPVTTILSCFESFPAVFTALTVKVDVPTVVGVPQINPVYSYNVKPAGKLPFVMDQVICVVPLAERF